MNLDTGLCERLRDDGRGDEEGELRHGIGEQRLEASRGEGCGKWYKYCQLGYEWAYHEERQRQAHRGSQGGGEHGEQGVDWGIRTILENETRPIIASDSEKGTMERGCKYDKGQIAREKDMMKPNKEGGGTSPPVDGWTRTRSRYARVDSYQGQLGAPRLER